ncbi:hypothetical protein G7Y89_g15433 [Cudoniella acicularis]|uniref:Telomerase reverse transcriptase n=1 Tax=Cudoniella acicularis TaxID=354080 RepID=A0A8H4QNX8_9HELO|nr:hypothetical protein G7Y89_g15433 [Cudoniella acicularis]
MAGKRKRKRPGNALERGEKRQKVSSSSTANGSATTKDPVVKQALLAQYYPRVFTLREYLLCKLPSTSKIRRKKIQCVGRGKNSEHAEGDHNVSEFLDQTLVGELVCNERLREDQWRQWTVFSQRADDSNFANVSGVGGGYSQSEIVDFAIWLLFSKSGTMNGGAQHLLCQGFRKDISSRDVNRDEDFTSAIPGVVSIYPNSNVTAMKVSPWPQVLNLLGKEGERLMIALILDCGIFVEVGKGRGIYHQLCGIPMGELQTCSPLNQKILPGSLLKSIGESQTAKAPSNIAFVRNRMLYARAALNAQGGVRFGLRHIREFNSESGEFY